MLNKVTFIIATFILHLCASQNNKNVDTQEVEAGKIVTLHCKSNDDHHNFIFWHLSRTDSIIGPKNDFNNDKFIYDIYSGNLTIKGVTPNEVGLYTCVSDGLDARNISVYSVNVVLKNSYIDTQEVEAGKIVTLHCKSNDDYHNFMFWHLSKTEAIIGPRNHFNNKKYKYEILSGNLTIKGVTPNEAGLYSCVSDGLDKRDISVHSINVVLKNWEYTSKNDFYGEPEPPPVSSHLWKVSVVLGSILVFLVILLVALHIYHRETEKPNYFDIIEQNDDDEDSTEELFTREPSTSSGLKNDNKNGIPDNFEKVYTVINMKT